MEIMKCFINKYEVLRSTQYASSLHDCVADSGNCDGRVDRRQGVFSGNGSHTILDDAKLSVRYRYTSLQFSTS